MLVYIQVLKRPRTDARQHEESGGLRKKNSRGLDPGTGTERIADVGARKMTEEENVENANIGKGEFDWPGTEARQLGDSGLSGESRKRSPTKRSSH